MPPATCYDTKAGGSLAVSPPPLHLPQRPPTHLTLLPTNVVQTHQTNKHIHTHTHTPRLLVGPGGRGRGEATGAGLTPAILAWHAPPHGRSRVHSGDRQGWGGGSTPPPATGRTWLASPHMVVGGLFSPVSGAATGQE